MRKRFLPVPLFALSMVFGASALSATTDLASMDWSVKSPHNFAADPPLDKAVVAFVAKMEGIAPDFSICSSHFADLRHSGNLSLVVSTSDGRFCDLNIFDQNTFWI
jgi:hypothetical protein